MQVIFKKLQKTADALSDGCLQSKGFVADHQVCLIYMAQVVTIKGVEFAAVTQEDPLTALCQHDLTQLGLFGGGIGDPSVRGQSPAGEKAQVCIKFPQSTLCKMSHIGRGIVQHQAAGTINIVGRTDEFLRGF